MTLIEREVQREDQIKRVLTKLEQLVIYANKKVEEYEQIEDESVTEQQKLDAAGAIGYSNGAFSAYAIVKTIFEGDYE